MNPVDKTYPVNDSSLSRRLYRITFIIALCIAILPPASYFWITYKSNLEGMLVEARMNAALVSKVIYDSPDAWQSEAHEIISEDLTNTELSEIRAITDLNKEVVTETSEVNDELEWPILTSHADIYGSNEELIGTMHIHRSLHPVFINSVFIGLGSTIFGMAIFLILHILPIRALSRTLTALQTEKADAQDKSERLTAVIENASDGIITLDSNLNIETFNPAAEKMFGYACAEIINRPVNTIIPKAETIYDTRIESFGRQPDATEFPVEITMSRAHLNGDAKIICIVHDISARKQIENELLQHREHLQELINAQTSDLIIAKERAEFASRAKSDFLSTMSHEIRTPINAILGMTYLALKTKLNSRQKDYLDKAYQSGQHLLHIINEILDFSKIEKGKLQIEAVDFRLEDLLSNVTSIIGESTSRKGLRLVINTHNTPPILRGDPLRIGQVLINLASNAIKFTESGEIQINIQTIPLDGDKLQIRFEVIDSGIGIDPKILQKLFQPFLQADTSISRKYGGTGLGLAICMLLVKLMGGEIGVDSTLGSGSKFWFDLSLEKGNEAKLPPKKGFLSFVSSTILNGVRILLAEDNLFNQEIAVEILQSAGAIVCVASNGLEVIDMLNKEPFDLVLMDVQMPELDGIEASKIIRGNYLYKNLPIIALTANATSEDRAICIAAGMDDFISKPVEPDQLSTIVAKFIAQDRITKGEPL